MTVPIRGIAADDFLRNYWQSQPLLIRQAFPGFASELDADDIAGLATDPLAESRLISGSYAERDWNLRYGPFCEDDFATLPPRNWTLLVQDVEKHYPPLQSIIRAFDFLPSWRIDDLMASIAAPGGSVGPHVDQYDVFLLQASGRRKWQIATTFEPELLPGCELNVLNSFTAEQEWVLEPGDMLYLPPGIAHHGVALSDDADPVMTWSIGTRAPSSADLLQALGDWLAANRAEGLRYRDPPLSTNTSHGKVDREAVEGLRKLISVAATDESDFPAFLGSFLSQYRLAHLPAPPEKPLKPADLQREIAEGAQLRHNPWTRLLWLEYGDEAILFAAGDRFGCTRELADRLCCDPVPLDQDGRGAERDFDLACRLFNDGHYSLQDPPG